MKKFFQDERGMIIEAVFLIPLMLVTTFAVIEFGWYFMREYAAQRVVNSIASYVQTVSPNVTMVDAGIINTNIKALVNSDGFGFIPENRVCVWAAPKIFCDFAPRYSVS